MSRLHAQMALLCAACIAASACGPEGDVEATRGAYPIVNGRAEAGYPSVGRMSNASGQLCTVSMIGHRTVLTAAHCVEGTTNPTVTLGDSTFAVATVHRHPQYTDQCVDSICYNDIAVLRLSETPNITPIPISSAAPTFKDSITLVGYGSSGIDDTTGLARTDYAKRSVTAVFAWTSGDGSMTFWSASRGGIVCHGDSGGPSFASIGGTQVQVGIHSRLGLKVGLFGMSPCAANYALDQRVDTQVEWIKKVSDGDVFVDATKPEPPADASADPETGNTPEPSGHAWVSTDGQPASSGTLKVSITAPAHRSVLANGLQVSIEVDVESTFAIQRVDLAINGQIVASGTAAPYHFPIALPQGTVRIDARAVDAGGQEARATEQIRVESASPHAQPDTGAENAAGASYDCQVSPSHPLPPAPIVALGALFIVIRRRRRADRAY